MGMAARRDVKVTVFSLASVILSVSETKARPYALSATARAGGVNERASVAKRLSDKSANSGGWPRTASS